MSMTALLVSLISIALVALICGLVCHKLARDYWSANIYTVLYTLFIFHGITYLEAGTFDPNWLVSSMIVAAVAIVVSIALGKYKQLSA